MIADNERLIIVLGMAHSGTTILTYLLRQHPEIYIVANGNEAWILENSWLPNELAEPIQGVLRRFPQKRILLKRPWNCVWHGEWMAREMPHARFIYCDRDFEAIAASWSKPTSFVDDRLRNGGLEHQRAHYEFCHERAETFAQSVPFFHRVDHSDFVRSPKETMARLAAWTGLPPFDYDVCEVGLRADIKRRLWPRPVRNAELGAWNGRNSVGAGVGVQALACLQHPQSPVQLVEELDDRLKPELQLEDGRKHEFERIDISAFLSRSDRATLGRPKPELQRGKSARITKQGYRIMTDLAGVYHYCRVGHDERPLELLADGTIGQGAGAAERRWDLRSIQGSSRLSIFGENGETCRLTLDSDGTWRGRWRKFERMPVELAPQSGGGLVESPDSTAAEATTIDPIIITWMTAFLSTERQGYG